MIEIITVPRKNREADRKHDWPGLKTMEIVVSIRQESAVAKESEVTVQDYISSKAFSAKKLLNASRSHWFSRADELDVGYRIW